jgi:hypothetical protein
MVAETALYSLAARPNIDDYSTQHTTNPRRNDATIQHFFASFTHKRRFLLQ